MSDLESRFHAEWLGLVQPVEGLVVSVPVLADAQCMVRLPISAQQRLLDLAPADPSGVRRIASLPDFLSTVLNWTPDLCDADAALADELSLYVPEGHQTLRPSLALRQRSTPAESPLPTVPSDDSTPASRAGSAYIALLWDLPAGLSLDKPEAITGPWEYPPAAKFDRLLRACRVPIGVLTNRELVRLVYAPHGESSGHITFRLDDMASVAGRPLFDAFVMLLGDARFFGVAPEYQLPQLLRDSRTRQSNVTNELAEQLLDAIHVLLAGFVGASERDGHAHIDDALSRSDDLLYKGLLTVLLRLVFVLYAEDRGLLPIEHPVYAEHLSVLGLFAQLQRDHGEHPDSMALRFGAWPRLVALFRAVFLGLSHGELVMPGRRGELFDPHRFAFLEGWGPAGCAPIDSDEQKHVRVPSVADDTVFRVLERLLVFQGQRLSYRALDVEQIGAVYEALMGYHVVRLSGAAVCVKPARVWIAAKELLDVAPAQRGVWLAETAALAKSAVAKLSEALKSASTEADAIIALEPLRRRGSANGCVGQFVIQPGPERRRTSSHYTPPSLTSPIVRRTLEPLLAAMGAEPPSARLLDLKVCDPAMGSGAFLVEACRFLGDQVVAAWTREGRLDLVASAHGDVVLHARRLVAQRCLYGVDKNPLAVSLARLSLWLVTLAKDEPFTFVDHALRHGDTLVGLDLEQIRSFHWKPGTQLEFSRELIDVALQEALDARQRILSLASADNIREKEHLLWDANDALKPVRLIADLVVGAFFACDKDKARELERKRRLDLVVKWLESGDSAPEELLAMQATLRERVPAFHWWVEFPEVFYAERSDPLDGDKVNQNAWMDAFVGNPPFMGGTGISEIAGGPTYVHWLKLACPEAATTTDLAAYFLRRAAVLLGENGSQGFIVTKSICESDTREAGLKFLLSQGYTLINVCRDIVWRGEAAVTVSTLVLTVGTVTTFSVRRFLDDYQVRHINSRLEAKPERQDADRLLSHLGASFVGTDLGSNGFVLEPDEARSLIASEVDAESIIQPVIGGREVNTSPDGAHDRFVINFGSRALSLAETLPRTLEIVRSRVKPERDRGGNHGPGNHGKKYWWQHTLRRDPLYASITNLRRCLVTAEVSKHLCFSFQPTNRVFTKQLFVFPFSEFSQFSVLQSRIHESWVRLLSSSLGGTLRYSNTDCFETFPFPQPDPRAVIPPLEDIGERLYSTRATYMVDTQQGLTQAYNQLKEPRCTEARVVELRRLHEEMDRAVLAAYGWDDLSVPPYGTPTTDAEKKALERFEDEVIDRLFALNAKRAEEERAQAEREAAAQPTNAKGKGVRKKKGDHGDGQGALGIG